MEQSAIIRAFGIQPDFDAMHEIKKRVAFLKTYLLESRQAAYVLGISGGVDSLTAGLLAQRAVRELREDGHAATFIAVRLPMGSRRTNTTRPPRSPPSTPIAFSRWTSSRRPTA